jgi:hypothetical protein
MKGAGDLVEKVIKIVYPSARQCRPCQKRKELLNKVLPFKKK